MLVSGLASLPLALKMGAKSSSRGGTRITLCVLHTNEGNNPADVWPDRTAENLARYLDGDTVAASYHVIVDDDSIVRYLPDNVAAWSVRSGNARSLNICLTGWARWTREEWLTHRSMLTLAATIVRDWCATHGIPVRKLTPPQVGADFSGICGHYDWTVGKRDGTHTDPGAEFPWDVFIDMVAGDDDMTSDQARKLDTIYHEVTQRLPSRSKYAGPRPWIDTVLGAALNAEGRAHEALVEQREWQAELPKMIEDAVRAALEAERDKQG